MRHQVKMHARKLLVDWLQTLASEDRKCIASMIGELDRWDVRDVIESGSFGKVEATQKQKKDRALKEKTEHDLMHQAQAAEHQRSARELRAGREGCIPNAPSELRIYPKLAQPPQCLYPDRTNCDHDLLNERCEFMKFTTENTGDFIRDSKAGHWACTAREK